MYRLLASNEFPEGLKNYRELTILRRNIEDWRESVAAYTNMLDTRQHAYDEEVPKADAVMAATDLDALTQKRVDFESRINAIEKSNDVAALGTADEQRTWARIKRIDDFVADASGRSGPCGNARQDASVEGRDVLAPVRELQGAALERAALGQGARGLLIETQKRDVQVRQARAAVPTNTGVFADRVAATSARMDELQARLEALTESRRTICRISRSRSWGGKSSASTPIKFRRASSSPRSTTRP